MGVGRGHTVSGGREGRWCEVEATGGDRRAAEKGRWWRVVRWRLGLGQEFFLLGHRRVGADELG